MTRARPDSPVVKDPIFSQAGCILPGCVLCLAAVGIGYGINLSLPGVSALTIAAVLGVLLTNTTHLPNALSPGIDLSAKKLLCAGTIFLGLKLPLTSIIDLGVPMLLVVAYIVTGGMLGTILLGRLLRVPPNLLLPIICGFFICGAVAMAGVVEVIDPDDEIEKDTIMAVALVVISGTLMILLVPLMAGLPGLNAVAAGEWAGGSTHGIARVMAIGGMVGGGALAVVAVVKLACVLLLVPVIAVLSLRQRRLQCSDIPGRQASRTKLPPIVSPFIFGFLVMVLLCSFVVLPGVVPDAGETLQILLPAAAMFGLGCGARVRNLLKVGLRPFGLAAASTPLVAVIAHAGVALAG